MVKRAQEPFKGTWMFPSGYSNYGEHPEETVRREIQEETGLKIVTVKLINILQSVDDSREPGHNLIFYKVDVEDGVLKTDEEENEAIAWFDIKNPPQIGFVTHQQVMKEIQEIAF